MAEASHGRMTKLTCDRPLMMDEYDQRLLFQGFSAFYLSDLTVADAHMLLFDGLAVEIRINQATRDRSS